jgi:hypothetical protein
MQLVFLSFCYAYGHWYPSGTERKIEIDALRAKTPHPNATRTIAVMAVRRIPFRQQRAAAYNGIMTTTTINKIKSSMNIETSHKPRKAPITEAIIASTRAISPAANFLAPILHNP